ncbi:hypothetical protein ACLB2K_055958 [Fragaria x ananassa]
MSHKNIWSAATLGGDDESGPSEPTTNQPNEPYQEESPHVVLDTEDIRVNNRHVLAIIGYIPVTPSELNSLQRNPNHDDDGFIDEEYIKDDEYSDQTEEEDDSDDSDYHESLSSCATPPPTTSANRLDLSKTPSTHRSTGSPSSTPTPESARRIVGSACLKVRSPTAPAPKKKRSLCFEKKTEDIVAQTGQKIKLEYCPRVKGPSVRRINGLVAHDTGSAIRSLVGMWARMFYDFDQEEKWKVWNAMSPKYEWDENDEPMFNWILKRAQDRYKD